MRRYSLIALAGVLTSSVACVTTTTTRTVRTAPRPGRVESIQETVRRTEGQPAAGAVAGAVVGGLLGRLITGRGAGALFGAAGGAVVGAAASEGGREDRTYDVVVRFDDGGVQVFRYLGYPAFQPGQPVTLTGRGLVAGHFMTPAAPPVEAPAPPPNTLEPESTGPPSTPAPSATPPPPPAAGGSATASPPRPPPGHWVHTYQYGWVWMPYGGHYTFTPDYAAGDPYMYVYYPVSGWRWVEAPWLWGWGPRPYVAPAASVNFVWYSKSWGPRWRGRRPAHYRGPRGRRAR